MSLSGWGQFPKVNTKALTFNGEKALKKLMHDEPNLIAFGNGRSYGDSALSDQVLKMTSYQHFLSFDEAKGVLSIESGVLLSDILTAMVPRGWFLQVTPGTKLITVGGAIASDVHGKNHHQAGCFSESVIEFDLMLPNGQIKSCSKTENSDLFHATCGGMGLTGIILQVKIQLKAVSSKNILQTTIKTQNLKQTFDAFEKYKNEPYSVAWIDCLATDDALGRCLLMVGDFAEDGDLNYQPKRKFKIPFFLPNFALNNLTVKLFNFLYFNKVNREVSQQQVDIDTFFYPLDALQDWYKIYGKNGFVQYQFILPKETSSDGLEAILKRIANSGKGSFLAVLKLYGAANDNYLSFPMEGYSLALDFKVEPGLFELLDELDELVLQYRGRIYLAKDARVKQRVFEQGYEKVTDFRRLRKKYKLMGTFNSMQSKRVGI
ncbi:MAG: FAD-binding oxidoreductase [Gammaproteobacteria bacterium]|nr:FAD-binding oxidoreductase [Gammaproteobacteria bacterium]